MTLLHGLFNTRNIQDFQRLLDANIDRRASTTASSPLGGSKSWTRSAGYIAVDVNARDSMGRTALHLASSSLESIEYVRALLKHPNIDPNLMDSESHWTALHRALYSANIPAACVFLLLRLFEFIFLYTI
jgi:ankyrin repeat protein